MKNIIALIENSFFEGTAPTLGIGAVAELDFLLATIGGSRDVDLLGVPPPPVVANENKTTEN